MMEKKLELFSLKQRIFLVKHFYQSFGDYKVIKNDYEAFYGDSKVVEISEVTVSALIDLFENTGSVLNAFRKIPQMYEDCMTRGNEKASSVSEVPKPQPKVENVQYPENPFEYRGKQEVPENTTESFTLTVIKEELDLDDEFVEEDSEFNTHEGTYPENEEYSEFAEEPLDNVQDQEECPMCEKKCRTLKGHKCFLLSCIYCHMKFPRKDIVTHMEVHHATKELHNCDFCDKFFLRRDSLESHRRTHTMEQPYMCRIDDCREKFKWRHALHRHEILHVERTTEEFKCTTCRISYRHKEHLEMHMKQWHNVDTLNIIPKVPQSKSETQTGRFKTCPHCYETYIITHNCTQKPAVEPKEDEELPGKDRPFICNFGGCGKSFCWQQSLRRHEHTHTDSGINLGYNSDLPNIHMTTIHKNPGSVVPGMQQEKINVDNDYKEVTPTVLCDKCNLVYPRNTQHNCDSMECVHCKKFFAKNEIMSHYQLEHAPHREHFCRTCGKFFRHMINLEKHQKTHIEEKKIFTCRVCGKICARKYDLKSHEKVHTSERPFVCGIGVCKKSFSWLQSLRRHERLHAKKNHHTSQPLNLQIATVHKDIGGSSKFSNHSK